MLVVIVVGLALPPMLMAVMETVTALSSSKPVIFQLFMVVVVLLFTDGLSLQPLTLALYSTLWTSTKLPDG